MQITIVGDCHMYIYLKDKKKHQHTGSLSDVKCHLLYDSTENFIGMRVLNVRSDTGENINLPKVGEVEFPLLTAKVSESDSEILILFDEEAQIHKEVADECVIDLCKDGITGIEPMPYTNISGKEIIQPFIVSDTAIIFNVTIPIEKCLECKGENLIGITRHTEYRGEQKGWKCYSCGQEHYLIER